MTAVWQFEYLAFGDQYAVVLSGGVQITPLDGEWTNPAQVSAVNAAVSEFPSGDANAGGDFTFDMTRLAGDGDVDSDDSEIIVANWDAINVGWSGGDLNEDGVVDVNDVWIWYAQAGLDLDVVS